MSMNVYMKTDTGRIRSSNQDAMFSMEPEQDVLCAAVCDGMGGANGGNVASTLCVKVLQDQLQRAYRSGMSEKSVIQMLTTALFNANLAIYEESQSNAELKGMGTTAVLALVQQQHLFVVHVGDSRALLLRGGTLQQLTRDHTIVQAMVDSGEISEQQAQSHPQKHIITRAVGVQREVDIDVSDWQLQENDLVLLCSDGLSNHLSSEQICEAAKRFPPQELAEGLVSLANENGGSDNITVVVISINGSTGGVENG